ADRAGVVVVAGVGRPEVEGAGRVELVRLRVRQRAVGDRVDGRGQVLDQAGAVVVGVEGVGNGAARVRGCAGERGRVVSRVTDLDRAGGHDRGRDARRVDRVVVGVGAGDFFAFLEVDGGGHVVDRLAAAVRAGHAAVEAVECPMRRRRILGNGVRLEVRDGVEEAVGRARSASSTTAGGDRTVGQWAWARRVTERGVPARRVLHDVDE